MAYTGFTMSGSRHLTTRVKTARGRKKSSTRWLQRQLNDPYVADAKRAGYRSRAAFKLLELDERFGLLKPGMRVLDLGAAPGGWTQVAVRGVGETGRVVGIDVLEMDPIPGATLLQLDFMGDEAPARILETIAGHPAPSLPPHAQEEGAEASQVRVIDLVLSDMAANATGHAPTDHLRIMHLCELAYHFAAETLSPGGGFVCKVLRGGTENQLLKDMKQRFARVKHAKPKASRQDSAESYVVATGFKG